MCDGHDVHMGSLTAVEVPALIVCQLDLVCWSRAFDDVSAAIADAYVPLSYRDVT